MLEKYKMFCRFVVEDMEKRGVVSEDTISAFSENAMLFLVGIAFFLIAVYEISPLLFSYMLLGFFGPNVVTVSIFIFSSFVAFDNLKNFIVTLKDVYNDASKN